jgi:hypothetical protein
LVDFANFDDLADSAELPIPATPADEVCKKRRQNMPVSQCPSGKINELAVFFHFLPASTASKA